MSGQGAGVGWLAFIMSFSSLLPKLKGRRREDEFNSYCPVLGAWRTSSRTNCPVRRPGLCWPGCQSLRASTPDGCPVSRTSTSSSNAHSLMRCHQVLVSFYPLSSDSWLEGPWWPPFCAATREGMVRGSILWGY